MFSFFKRKWKGLVRRLAWFRYGILYLYSSRIRIPSKLRINWQFLDFKFIDSNSEDFRYEFEEICVNDCYKLKQLRAVLGQVNHILDIGANQGLFVLAARRHFSGATIHCYEPNPQIFPLLQYNSKQLNAQSFNEAATLEDSRIELIYSNSNLHTRSTNNPNGKIAGSSFLSILNRLDHNIDIVKLDCEGAEWDLFRDCDSWNCIKGLTMEYHLWAKPGKSRLDIIELIQKLAFNILSHNPIGSDFGLITAVKNEAIRSN